MIAYEPDSVAADLFARPFRFDFFQAVRLLETLQSNRSPLGRPGLPTEEIVRIKANNSLVFPASQIQDLKPAAKDQAMPVIVVNFMGLTGPMGALPQHYTEQVMRQIRDFKDGDETRYALRDWLDLFNHRMISHFYRAWEKYRFYVPFERGETTRDEPDAFTTCLLSFLGLNLKGLRDRLRVTPRIAGFAFDKAPPLAQIRDLALMHYAGFLSSRAHCVLRTSDRPNADGKYAAAGFAYRRNAVSLEAMLEDYFCLPIKVKQFQGQWLYIDRASQSRLGAAGPHNRLGVDLFAGERVFDAQSKFRLRVGPLRYKQFVEFMPDRAATPERKTFFMLCHMTRLYVGPELDFDVQLILHFEDIPACQLKEKNGRMPQLGWNTWMISRPAEKHAEDVVFADKEIFDAG